MLYSIKLTVLKRVQFRYNLLVQSRENDEQLDFQRADKHILEDTPSLTAVKRFLNHPVLSHKQVCLLELPEANM